MKNKQLIFCLFLSLISHISCAQNSRIYFGIQYNPEIYRYSSYHFNWIIQDLEATSKTNTNYGVALFGGYNFMERFNIHLGINYIKRTFSINEVFNHCLLLPPGEICPYVYILSTKQEYRILEYPLGFSIYLFENSNRIKPKINYNIIGKQLINVTCYVPRLETHTEKQLQFYGIASNVGIGMDILFTSRIKLEISCLYRFYNLRREQPILYGDNSNFFRDKSKIWNFSFGLVYSFSES